ncbi:MAG: radical SAM/SPASM domain-containing protein [Endomicrobiia bacterium]
MYICYLLKIRKRLSYPAFISFEPTNCCNLQCFECPVGNGKSLRNKGYADIELFKKIISENKKYLINILLYFQGEPFMHPQIEKLILIAKENKIFTEISTNAVLIPEVFDKIKDSLPDKLIISFDGITDETYLKYRKNSNLIKVTETLELLSTLPRKKRPYIEVQFLVFKHNANDISKLKEFLSSYKIDKISLKTAQVSDFENIDILPDKPKLSRYKVVNNKLMLKYPIKNKCKRIIFGSVISYDGNLLPCCFDKNSQNILGNVNKSTISEIRNSKKYQNFVNQVFTDRKKIMMCTNCTEGQKNIKISL